MKKNGLTYKIFFLFSICLIPTAGVQAESTVPSECGGASCNDFLDDVSCNVAIGNKLLVQNTDAGCGIDVPLSCADYLDTVKIKFDIDTEDGVIFEKYVNKDNNSEIGYRSCTDECAIVFAGKCKFDPCLNDPKYGDIGKQCEAVNTNCNQRNVGEFECINGQVVCNVTQPTCVDQCDNLSITNLYKLHSYNDYDTNGDGFTLLEGKELEAYGKAVFPYVGDRRSIVYVCIKNPNTDGKNVSTSFYLAGYEVSRHTNQTNYVENAKESTYKHIVDKNMFDSNACYVCAYARSWGCFAPETKISLADGSVKQAKDVAAGDVLFNPITRKGVTVDKVVEGPEDVGMILIEFAGGSLKVSQEHPILTKNGLVQARDLKAGDIVFNGDNKEFEVASVKTLPVEEGQYVINFIVKGDGDVKDYKNRMLLSEGVITGDLTTQIELKLGK